MCIRDRIITLLKQRLQYIDGLDYTDEAVAEIARLVATYFYGDFRKALEMTLNIVRNKGRLYLEDVEAEWKSEKRRFWIGEFSKLNPHQLIILYALAYMSVQKRRKTGEEYPHILYKDLASASNTLCKKFNIRSISPRMMTYWINRLEENGWLVRVKSDRKLYVTIGHNPETLLDAFEHLDWDIVLAKV